MTTALGKTCAACHVERKRKGILYHPDTFMPYCENPYICNENHPNSGMNIALRAVEKGKENAILHLVTFEEAQEMFKQWVMLNHPDQEKAQKIRRMVTHPISVRIGDPETAEFILDYKEEFGFSSISDAVRHCVDIVRETRSSDIARRKALKTVENELQHLEKEKHDEPTPQLEQPKEESWSF